MKRTIVIGAGASGLMAAVSAARCGAAVTVIEHNASAGKKLLLTGSGKCNLTNGRIRRGGDDEALSRAYHGDMSFALKTVKTFDFSDCVAFFWELGLETTQRSYRFDKEAVYVYPASMESASVLYALLDECRRLGVMFVFSCTPEALYPEKTKDKSDRWRLDTDKGSFISESVIFATGSNAAPATGSDSSIYPILKVLGHSFKPFQPALCALRPPKGSLDELKGVRFEAKVTLSVCSDDDIKSYVSKGEVQIGGDGISGICVMDISRYAAVYLKRGCSLELSLCLLPDMDDERLISYLRREIDRRIGDLEALERLLLGLLPGKLSVYLVRLALKKAAKRAEGVETSAEKAEIDSHLAYTADEIDKEIFIKALFDVIRDLRSPIIKTVGFQHSQCASGGVSTLEVDEHTMESKLHKGIYFCGELLDVDGICGGYNLHFAWASGFLAGKAAAQYRYGPRA